jgi:CubicO group peptidase (beta-lactamase class C family)
MSQEPTGDETTRAPIYYHPVADSAWARVGESSRVLPQSQPLITLANWQEPPHLTWSFQHMRELMPSQVIHGNDLPRPLPEDPQDLGSLPLNGIPFASNVDEAIAGSETDGCLVIKDGTIVLEQYFGPMVPRSRHLVMSVSKSIVSAVAASLYADGLLDPDSPAEDYVPQLAGSGYAGATVRNVLDMRTGVRFHETYLDAESEVRVMERSMGWAPRNHGDPLGMYPYILATAQETDHNGIFTYRSIDTDTLGWIVEHAAKRRMADLVSERIWHPMGASHDAEVTVDPLGSAIHDGGISATLRDLGRFGLMLLDEGLVNSRQIIPAEWIQSASYPPSDVREAFARSENEPYLPGGWYRNQFWFVPGENGPILLCLGIHGQMVFVEAATHTVGVKLSSWPTPQHLDKLTGAIATFRQIARHLS